MGLDRRGRIVQLSRRANRSREERDDKAKPSYRRLNIGSRVNREAHARFWEQPEVQFLRLTRQFQASSPSRSDPRIQHFFRLSS